METFFEYKDCIDTAFNIIRGKGYQYPVSKWIEDKFAPS